MGGGWLTSRVLREFGIRWVGNERLGCGTVGLLMELSDLLMVG